METIFWLDYLLKTRIKMNLNAKEQRYFEQDALELSYAY